MGYQAFSDAIRDLAFYDFYVIIASGSNRISFGNSGMR